VNALFSSRSSGPLKMFHHVGQVHLRGIDTGLLQSVVEQSAGRSNKRMPRPIFLVLGLLAYKHDRGFKGPSPKTVCAAVFHKSQALQSLAALRSPAIVLAAGLTPAAVAEPPIESTDAPETTFIVTHPLLARRPIRHAEFGPTPFFIDLARSNLAKRQRPNRSSLRCGCRAQGLASCSGKSVRRRQSDNGDQLQELVPPGRERIHQGQQFDETQQQKKNPDGAPREQEQA